MAAPSTRNILPLLPTGGPTTYNQTLAVTATFTAADSEQVGKVLAVGMTGTAVIVKRANKTLALGATFTVALQAIKVILKTLAVTATFTVAFVRQTAKAIPASATFAVGIAKRIGHALGVVGSWLTSLVGVKSGGGGPVVPMTDVAGSDVAVMRFTGGDDVGDLAGGDRAVLSLIGTPT